MLVTASLGSGFCLPLFRTHGFSTATGSHQVLLALNTHTGASQELGHTHLGISGLDAKGSEKATKQCHLVVALGPACSSFLRVCPKSPSSALQQSQHCRSFGLVCGSSSNVQGCFPKPTAPGC